MLRTEKVKTETLATGLKAYLDDDSESDDDSGTSRQSESSDQLKGNVQSQSLAGLA